MRDELKGRRSVPCGLHSSPNGSPSPCPFTGPPRLQVVIAGVFSPVSDGYAKPFLASAQHRVELVRLACASTSDWLAVDSWEACLADWSRTALVANHLQARLEEVLSRLVDSTGEPLRGGCEGLATDQWLADRIRLADGLVSSRYSACIQSASNTNSNSSPPARPSFTRVPRVKFVCGYDVVHSFFVPNLWSDEDMELLLGHYGVVLITRPGKDISQYLNKQNFLSRFMDNIITVSEWFENGLSSTAIREALSKGYSVRYLVPEAALKRIYALGLYGSGECSPSHDTKH